MNKKELILARKKIDKLDNKIFDLIKKRTKIVKYMMSIKKVKIIGNFNGNLLLRIK